MASGLTVSSAVGGSTVIIPNQNVFSASSFGPQGFSSFQKPQESILSKTLNLFAGFNKLDVGAKTYILNELTSIKDVDGSPYLDPENPFQVMEIAQLLWKDHPGGDFDPQPALQGLINTVKTIAGSGDHFIWALPIMVEYEEQQKLNIKKEFASLEGIQIPQTDPNTGVKSLMTCSNCKSTWWNVPTARMTRRGDEALEKNANCRECGRPRRNI